MKKCGTCKVVKPTDDFGKNRARSDGLRGVCKVCESAAKKRIRAANPERFKAADKAQYQKNIEVKRTQARERARRRREDDPEAERAKVREWRNANRERYREIVREAGRRWRERNPELARERHRDYAHRYYWQDPDKYRERAKQWAADNPDKVRESRERLLERDPDAERRRLRAYRQRHPERIRSFKRNRRALERGADGDGVSADQWRKIVERFGSRCAYCGTSESLEQEHVEPIIRGGMHTESNVIPACRSCNASKNDRFLLEWVWSNPERFLGPS